MVFVRQTKFIFAHTLGDIRFYSMFKIIKKNEFNNYEMLKNSQNKLLKKMITYSYNQVPFYKKLFEKYVFNSINIGDTIWK